MPVRAECQNQKLQRRKNADVYVFDAGKAGKGLKTACDLEPGTFIMEYVGEVIDWQSIARDEKYKEEGLIHRYFLLLDSDQGTDDENIYIDSQKRFEHAILTIRVTQTAIWKSGMLERNSEWLHIQTKDTEGRRANF